MKSWNYQVAGTITVTTTGNIDDLDFQYCSVILMNNATLSTIRGLKAGFPGQEVTIISIGAGQVNLAHQNAGSAAANRLINFVTSISTPLAASKGNASYKYDETTVRWRLIDHNQGDFIDISYDAANFTASGTMVWSVSAGDQESYLYYLEGRSAIVAFNINTSSISGTLSSQLWLILPFTINKAFQHLGRFAELVSLILTSSVINLSMGATDNKIIIHRLDFSNFTAQTDTAYVFGNTTLSVL